MDLNDATWWWAAAGIAVLAELLTGTFYLLMVAAGLGAGAIAAHLGAGVNGQLMVAAVVAGAATAAWHRRRSRAPNSAPAERNRDVNLDIGERVHVAHWSSDGTTQVQYRGSSWKARLQAGAPALPGEYRVAAVEANSLVLAPKSLL